MLTQSNISKKTESFSSDINKSTHHIDRGFELILSGGKKKRPKSVAVVDEDNCTGCQACVPFCPVDCIESVPKDKYDIPIPPVQIRFDECIGCVVCARVCTKMTWDAIRMIDTDTFEELYGTEIS